MNTRTSKLIFLAILFLFAGRIAFGENGPTPQVIVGSSGISDGSVTPAKISSGYNLLTTAEKNNLLSISNLDVFSACATTSQSIPVGDVLTKVGFPIATDTAGFFSVFDPAGWQISSTTVRLPKTGYYQVNLNVFVAGGDSGKRVEFLLVSAGYTNLSAQVPVGVTAVQSFTAMSCILKITVANSEVYVLARNSSTSAAVSVGYSNTRLSIKYLGGL